MNIFASIVFILCTATSGLCTGLMWRAYRRSPAPAPLLLWSALCFLLLTLNNVLVYVDIETLPQVDLSILRFATSLFATGVLIYGFVWDT
jgi:Family of unknown function (DUF5985)